MLTVSQFPSVRLGALAILYKRDKYKHLRYVRRNLNTNICIKDCAGEGRSTDGRTGVSENPS